MKALIAAGTILASISAPSVVMADQLYSSHRHEYKFASQNYTKGVLPPKYSWNENYTNRVKDDYVGLQQLIQSWLAAHNYTPPQQQAILRRIHVESRFHPDVISRSGSACLLQWTATRRTNLFRFAHTDRCPGWETQMEFMDLELKTVPAYRRFWLAGNNSYNVLTKDFSRPPR